MFPIPDRDRAQTRLRLRAVVIITLVALVLRLYQISAHSLSFDEVVTAQSIRYQTLGDLLGWAANHIDQTPLLFVLTWLLRPLGGGEMAVRLPLVIAGTLTVPAIYYLGRELSTWTVGMAAAGAVAIAPLAVHNSQDAQSYALLMLFATLQMYFAYRVAVTSGRFDWLGLALSTTLAIYASPLGVVSSVTAFGFIVAIELLDRGSAATSPGSWVPAMGDRRARSAAVALLVALVACLPLIPGFAKWLSAGDIGFAGMGDAPPLTGDFVLAVLSALDVRGPVLALVIVGLVIAGLQVVSNRDPASLLLLMWIGVPVAGYLLVAGITISAGAPQYFAIAYPALLLLAINAVFAVARIVADAVGALGRRVGQAEFGSHTIRLLVAGAVAGGIALLVLADWVPALGYSYTTAKGEDSRAIAEAIAADGNEDTNVVVLGARHLALLDGIGYYLWLRGSPVSLVDGELLDDAGQARVQGRGDLVAVIADGANRVPSKPPPGGTFRHFHGLTLIDIRDDGAPQIGRVRSLLAWAEAFDPAVARSRELIDRLQAPADRTGNLLARAKWAEKETETDLLDVWTVPSGAARQSNGRIDLVPGDAEANATITTRVEPGRKYAVTFGCTGTPRSNPRLYVTEGSVSDLGRGVPGIEIYPSGAGYRCTDDGSWRSAAFDFEIRPGIHKITIWLRAAAPTASFRDVRLEELR